MNFLDYLKDCCKCKKEQPAADNSVVHGRLLNEFGARAEDSLASGSGASESRQVSAVAENAPQQRQGAIAVNADYIANRLAEFKAGDQREPSSSAQGVESSESSVNRNAAALIGVMRANINVLENAEQPLPNLIESNSSQESSKSSVNRIG